MWPNGSARSSRASSTPPSAPSAPASTGRLFTLTATLMTLALLAIGCAAEAPRIVLVPALPNEDPDPLTLAQPIRARFFAYLPDGTMTISKPLDIPAGCKIVWPQVERKKK